LLAEQHRDSTGLTPEEHQVKGVVACLASTMVGNEGGEVPRAEAAVPVGGGR
jgi:hypothetical protein